MAQLEITNLFTELTERFGDFYAYGGSLQTAQRASRLAKRLARLTGWSENELAIAAADAWRFAN